MYKSIGILANNRFSLYNLHCVMHFYHVIPNTIISSILFGSSLLGNTRPR